MSILETLAERRILEAQRQGAFERLRGQGRPLKLDGDEHVPAEWRAAFHLLQQAGLAPEWIVRRQQIEMALAEARRRREHSERGQAAQLRFAAEIEAINRQIDDYNLSVPHASLQRRRVGSDG